MVCAKYIRLYMNINVIHFLIKLKSAVLLKKELFFIKNNKAVLKFLTLFYKYNFIQSFKYKQGLKKILVRLKVFSNVSFLKHLRIISTGAKTRYLTYLDISKILNKNIFLLFSSTSGILTASDCKKSKVGGKLLFIC